MESITRKRLATIAFIGPAVIACALGANKMDSFVSSFKADDPNILTIDKNSYRDATIVQAKTAKGNTVDFKYSRFDTRPGDTTYNNCICFYKDTGAGDGGYIYNVNPILGVREIKIYHYAADNPNPGTLTPAIFDIFYGYGDCELIIGNENFSKVQTKNGYYCFEEGLEPSYIAIKATVNYDICISKVEVTYNCEETQGTVSENEEAFKYAQGGNVFTGANGKEVSFNSTKPAPWVKFDDLGSDLKCNTTYKQSTFDTKTNVFTTTTGNDYICFSPLGSAAFNEFETRKIISITFMLSTVGETGWGGTNCDIYFGINKSTSTPTYSRIHSNRVLRYVDGWEEFYNILSIVDTETNEDLTGKSIVNRKVTITSDFSSVSEAKDVHLGTSCKNVSVEFFDITFKESLCGHPGENITRTASEATCGKPGYVEYSCDAAECSDNYIKFDKFIFKHNLILQDGLEPTCTTNGFKSYYKCSDCNNVFEDANGARKIDDLEAWKNGNGSIPKIAHKEDNDWQKDATYHWHNCVNNNCTEQLGKAAHTWDAGTITKEPTCTEKGEKTYTCTVCGQTKIEEVDVVEHDWVSKASEESFKYESKNTWSECSVCEAEKDRVAERAPWADTPLDFDHCETINSSHDKNKGFGNPEISITNDGVSYTGYYNGGILIKVGEESQDRNIMSISVKSTQVSWGANFYMRVFTDTIQLKQILPVTQFYNGNISVWNEKNGKVYNSQEVEVSSINSTEFFTYEIDLSNKLVAGERVKSIALWSGYSDDDSSTDFSHVPTLAVNKLTFKETYCGHKASCIEKIDEKDKHQDLRGYEEFACSICNHTYKVYEPADWQYLTPTASSKYDSKNGNYYNFENGGKDNDLFFSIPSQKLDRTDLAITASIDRSSYELFYLSGTGAKNFGKDHYQFFSPDMSNINYDSCPFVKGILRYDGVSLGYNSETFKVANRINATDEITIIIDLTHPDLQNLNQIKIYGSAASANASFKVALRKPIDYSSNTAILMPNWDNWSSSVCKLTNNSANFTISETESASGEVTLGWYGKDGGDTNKHNFTNKDLMVRRLTFKMVKDLNEPDKRGSMQWHLYFSGGTNSRIVFGNASTAFVQKPDIHLLDKNGNLLENGSKIELNKEYYVELLYNSTNMPNHLKFNADGITNGETWGYGHLIIKDFDVCLSKQFSSFAD